MNKNDALVKNIGATSFLEHYTVYLQFRGVLQLCEDPVPVGEALAALDAGGQLVVFDLAVQHRLLRRQLGVLDEPNRALVALFAADA